jgi:hypothetical protein
LQWQQFNDCRLDTRPEWKQFINHIHCNLWSDTAPNIPIMEDESIKGEVVQPNIIVERYESRIRLLSF